jgi:peptidoglycan/LPS O-acetylase OafA/YrhL
VLTASSQRTRWSGYRRLVRTPPRGEWRFRRGDRDPADHARNTRRRGFRPDVEGLRAVAVVLVVLYHCKAVIPGGYVGVDVFFVISGFLITRQLLGELMTTGRISMRGFYARRARRILPAATLTTIVTVVLAGLLLAPLQALRVFSDARAAALFGANIHFAALQADYFTAGRPPSPLEHYWSLSVEEQFYLVWPLVLVITSLGSLGVRRRSDTLAQAPAVGRPRPASDGGGRVRLGVVMVVLSAIGTLSFVDCLVLTPGSSAWAYYSTFSRAWELAAGAMVALSLPLIERVDRRLATALTWTGLLCIALAATIFSSSTPYPGVAALLPVAGAAAILAAGAASSKRWGAAALLATKPFQRVGTWSYSWYLWHFPALILAPAILGHPLSVLEALMVAAVSLVIAVMTFVLVERPIRHMQLVVRRPVLAIAAAAAFVGTSLAVVAVAPAVLASFRTGPPARPPINGPNGSLTAKQLAADLRLGVQILQVPSNLQPSIATAADDKPVIDTNGCLLGFPAAQSKGCLYGDTSSRTSVVLFGDSHAAAWFPALDVISKRHDWRLVVLTKSACAAEEVNLVRYGRVYSECRIWRSAAERQIAALHPALVVVASSQYVNGMRRLAGVPTGHGGTWQNGVAAIFDFLHHAARRTLYLSDVPTLTQPAPDCLSAHPNDVPACTTSTRTAFRYPQLTADEIKLAAQEHINAINTSSWFCTPTVCPVIVGNILLYQDSQHMVPQWSVFLAPVLDDVVTRLMAGIALGH